MKNKKKGKRYPRSTIGSAVRKQEEALISLTAGEKIFLLLKSVLVIGIIDYFFYREWMALLPLSLVGAGYYRMEKEALLFQKKGEAREQFKELMLLVSTGQKAGYSAENAFLSGYHDMKNLYGTESAVCKMLKILQTGRENNIDFSALWNQIGEQTQIAEIQEFASVYEISGKSSGNMAEVMEKTADIIIRKSETEKEIEVLLSARKLEQKIMNAMPFLIVLYINITSPGYFDGLYHCAGGAVIMTVCLLLYAGAYLLSQKMIPRAV
ncbi:MAG: hypothetical protein NC429_12175 [Lachnospiraceae bacterium]|nr:hypothetical protein [Lachnospiraceae bacterium]